MENMNKTKNNKRTKKQHYIAQGIIKLFFDSTTVYEKNIHNGKVYESSVENTMCMNNSYEISIFEDNFLEKIFAMSIDEETPKLIKELKTLLNKNDYVEVKKKLFTCIRIFLINYYKSITSLIHMSSDMTKKDQNSITRMINTIFNMPYIDRISKILCTGYDFIIIKSKASDFVLSDQYISSCSLKFMGRFINISNREIGLKNTIVLIPITKDYYGMFINGELPSDFEVNIDSINELNETQTQKINTIIYNNSYEKCISAKEETITNLIKKNSTTGDSMVLANFASGNDASFKIKQEVFFTDDEYDTYNYYESYKWGDKKYKTCRVNDMCPCGSNIKYKKCCKEKVDKCINILNTMYYQQEKLMINKKLEFEDPVQLSNYEKSELKSKFKFLKK